MKQQLLLLPGLMCNEKLWSKMNLTNYKTFDIPREDTIDEMVEQLHISFAKYKEPINLVGFSLGGYLALKYVIKYPTRINKALIISSGIDSLKETEILKRKKMLETLKRNNINSLSFMAISQLLEDKTNEENLDIINQMFDELGLEVYNQQLLATMRRKPLFDELINVNAPIQFLSATNDSLVNLEPINKLCEMKDNFQLKTLDTDSHMLPLEYEHFLYKEIQNFF
ncbi:alpha/beta fold hydrolase [Halarcobacter sp.]|uniref:alpha/beta fold hydrolase n=1 Tax=Halarcobacter sp. TaxID=2321133 RepID=UPI003A929D2C